MKEKLKEKVKEKIKEREKMKVKKKVKNTKNWYTIDALGAIYTIFIILDTFTKLLQYFYNTNISKYLKTSQNISEYLITSLTL